MDCSLYNGKETLRFDYYRSSGLCNLMSTIKKDCLSPCERKLMVEIFESYSAKLRISMIFAQHTSMHENLHNEARVRGRFSSGSKRSILIIRILNFQFCV